MPEIEVTALVNSWRTRMHMPEPISNGGPIPEDVEKLIHIGTRFQVIIKGPQEEIAALCKALEMDLLPELWISRNGRFA